MFKRFLNLGSTAVVGGLTFSTVLTTTACSGDAATGPGSSVSVPGSSMNGSSTAGSSGTGNGSAGQSSVAGSDDDTSGLDVGGAGIAVGTGGGGNFQECAGDVQAAQPIGLDMYVVLDRSGSMEDGRADEDAPGDCPLSLDGTPTVTSKWCFATHALAKYFASAGAVNNRAALQYMPLEGEEGGDEDEPGPECMTGGGITQAEVPLSALPIATATDALVQSLNTAAPEGRGTPIQAALHGIAAYTAANKDATRTMIGVFITDGDPSGCEEDAALLAPIVSAHLAATGLKTFIIGMNGASNENLQLLAVAGGAPPHMDFCGVGAPTPCNYWNVGTGDPAAFVNALQQIQLSAALPCDFNIPPPPDTQDLDPDLVNVTFTNLGVSNVLGRVNDVTACTGDGWYYDNIAAPTKVQLCPTTCTTAESAGQDAKVDITFGCETIIQ